MTAWRLLLPFGLALGAGGCAMAPREAAVQPLVAQFFLEARPSEEGKRVVLPLSEVEIVVSPKPVVMEFDIVDADVAQVALGRCLQVSLTMAAARDLYRISGASLGRRLVLSLNGEPVGARRLDQPLGDGAIHMFLEKPDDQLPALVERLKGTSKAVRREISRK